MKNAMTSDEIELAYFGKLLDACDPAKMQYLAGRSGTNIVQRWVTFRLPGESRVLMAVNNAGEAKSLYKQHVSDWAYRQAWD